MARQIFVKVRADEKERTEWNKVAESRGTTLSKLIRSHMERIVKNEQRKEARE